MGDETKVMKGRKMKITEDSLFVIAEVDPVRKLRNNTIDVVEGQGFTVKQLKEMYAKYLDKTYPESTDFPAREGLNNCGLWDVLGQMTDELGIQFITNEEYKKNTKNLKKEIVEFVDFMERNRDKDYKYFEKYYEDTGHLEATEEPDLLDFNPDSKALILSTLSFDEEGKILRCIADINENDLFDDYLVIEGITYNHKEIEKFFNQKVLYFNEIQDAAREIQKTVKTRDLVQAAQLVCSINKYMCSPYGAGEDYSYMEIAKFINENKGKFVDLAYTELGNENQYIVQVAYDLNTNRYKYEVNGIDVTPLTKELEPKDNNLDNFIHDMEVADFDDVISECYDVIEKVYGEEWESIEPEKEYPGYLEYKVKWELDEGGKEMSYQVQEMTADDHQKFKKEPNVNKLVINSNGEKVALTEEEAKYFEKKYKNPQHNSIESNRNVGDGVVGKSVKKGR